MFLQQKLASGVKNHRLLILFETRPRGPQEAARTRGLQDGRMRPSPRPRRGSDAAARDPQDALARPPGRFKWFVGVTTGCQDGPYEAFQYNQTSNDNHPVQQPFRQNYAWTMLARHAPCTDGRHAHVSSLAVPLLSCEQLLCNRPMKQAQLFFPMSAMAM